MDNGKKSIKEIEEAMDKPGVELESLPSGEIREINWKEKAEALQKELEAVKTENERLREVAIAVTGFKMLDHTLVGVQARKLLKKVNDE